LQEVIVEGGNQVT